MSNIENDNTFIINEDSPVTYFVEISDKSEVITTSLVTETALVLSVQEQEDISVISNSTEVGVQFNGAGGSSTASNVGTAGVGVFKQKTGNDLEFKKIAAGSNKVTITDNTTNSTVDIDVVVANLGVAAKYTTLVGNNSDTNIVVTHNLNSRDVSVTLREAGSPYAMVFTDVEFTDLNTLTLKFAVAPTTNQYSVTVIG